MEFKNHNYFKFGEEYEMQAYIPLLTKQINK